MNVLFIAANDNNINPAWLEFLQAEPGLFREFDRNEKTRKALHGCMFCKHGTVEASMRAAEGTLWLMKFDRLCGQILCRMKREKLRVVE